MIEIQLTRGQIAIIDDCDLHFIENHSWHATERRDGNGWYAKTTKGVRMHRLLMQANVDQIVDHIDGNGLNNRRNNLRIGSQSQNCVNRKRTPGFNLRGTRPKKGKWQAYIKYQGKQKSLGYFDTQEDAHSAYLSAATALHGEWMPLPPAPEGGK